MCFVEDVLLVEVIEMIFEGGDGIAIVRRETLGRHHLVHLLEAQIVADDREPQVRISSSDDRAQEVQMLLLWINKFTVVFTVRFPCKLTLSTWSICGPLRL